MTPRQWVYVATVVLVLTAGALLAGPPQGSGTSPLTSRRPTGFLALARFLRTMGVEVRQADDPPSSPGTFALLNDFRDELQAAPLLEWVARGGRLIVADPDSTILAALNVSVAGPIGGVVGATGLEPRCVSSQAVGVSRVVVRVSDLALAGGGVAATSCYRGSRGSFAVTIRHGSGTVVLLGGGSPFTNELLDHGDNAAFALGVFAAARSVTFGPALPPGGVNQGQQSIWTLLPDGARAALVALAVAAVAFAVTRGRRLGRPIKEQIPSPIPASELVVATGRLYRAARATAHAGRMLREGLTGRLGRRVGLPPGTSPDELAATIGDGDEGRLLREQLGGPDPRNDEELIALGRGLEALRARVEGSRR
jgi:hypothetical protein